MARNHRGFLETTLAAAKLGASALYLNTMFAGPQLVDVMDREGPKALVYDEEFDRAARRASTRRCSGSSPGTTARRRRERRRSSS